MLHFTHLRESFHQNGVILVFNLAKNMSRNRTLHLHQPNDQEVDRVCQFDLASMFYSGIKTVLSPDTLENIKGGKRKGDGKDKKGSNLP